MSEFSTFFKLKMFIFISLPAVLLVRYIFPKRIEQNVMQFFCSVVTNQT